MRALLSVASTAVTLLWLASAPWYQHLPWMVRAGIVLASIALSVLGARAVRPSGSGQEEDQ